MADIYGHALRLLAARDYSGHQLRLKLERRFGDVPDEVIHRLTEAGYLDDHRFAENFVRRRIHRGRPQLAAELERHGIADSTVQEVIQKQDWPSTQEMVKSKMKNLRLEPPLSKRDAARLIRAVERLGYDAEAILRELEDSL